MLSPQGHRDPEQLMLLNILCTIVDANIELADDIASWAIVGQMPHQVMKRSHSVIKSFWLSLNRNYLRMPAKKKKKT